MFKPQPPISAYLAKPASRRRGHTWNGFRTQFYEIRRYNPGLLQNAAIIFILWCGLVGAVQGASQLSPHANAAKFTGAQPASGGSVASHAAAPTQLASAPLPTVTLAKALPGGPSGELLPPGTMAPDRTYANGYTWGQCTWYVAGRRQIPPNWGNAVSWYYHAAASGWSVGTTPAIAAVAWTPAGYYGHVALVEQVSADGSQVYVSEMNYRGVGIKSFRWVPASSFKYIY